MLLEADAESGLGAHPWDRLPPVVLDTTAALELGYRPAGDYAATVAAELDWLVATPEARPLADDPSFASSFDYAAEDRYLATLDG